jgi:hypothetical protein
VLVREQPKHEPTVHRSWHLALGFCFWLQHLQRAGWRCSGASSQSASGSA